MFLDSTYSKEELLSEGFFSKTLTEVDYTSIIEQFQDMQKKLKELIKKTSSCKSVKTFDEKKYYPNLYVLGNRDFRITAQQYMSEPFSLIDLERKSGLTENIVVKEINSILDEMCYAYKDINLTIVYFNNTGEYAFYGFMDAKKCLKNIINNKKPKEVVDAAEITKEFNTYREKVILEVKKNYLCKGLRFDKNYKSKIYKYAAASGSGICYCLQEQSDGFIDKDFSSISPKITSFTASMSMAYMLEETMLKDTHISLNRFYNDNGSYSLWLVSRPNIKVTF